MNKREKKEIDDDNDDERQRKKNNGSCEDSRVQISMGEKLPHKHTTQQKKKSHMTRPKWGGIRLMKKKLVKERKHNEKKQPQEMHKNSHGQEQTLA